MDLLERALRAAAVPVRYTEGYNPHIRLSMGPALSLGAEAFAEPFDVECHGEVTPAMLARANEVLPIGIALVAAERLDEGAAALGKAIATATFHLTLPPGTEPWPPAAPAGLAGVIEWAADGGDLVVTANARQSKGPTPGVKQILAAAGVPADEVSAVRVVRKALGMESRPEKPPGPAPATL